MSKPTVYGPDGERETALSRARRFFADNPGEVLLRGDVQLKFSCCKRTASSVIRALISEGSVQRSQLPRAPRRSQAKRPVAHLTA